MYQIKIKSDEDRCADALRDIAADWDRGHPDDRVYPDPDDMAALLELILSTAPLGADQSEQVRYYLLECFGHFRPPDDLRSPGGQAKEKTQHLFDKLEAITLIAREQQHQRSLNGEEISRSEAAKRAAGKRLGFGRTKLLELTAPRRKD